MLHTLTHENFFHTSLSKVSINWEKNSPGKAKHFLSASHFLKACSINQPIWKRKLHKRSANCGVYRFKDCRYACFYLAQVRQVLPSRGREVIPGHRMSTVSYLSLQTCPTHVLQECRIIILRIQNLHPRLVHSGRNLVPPLGKRKSVCLVDTHQR